jgi:hypothetical protein
MTGKYQAVKIYIVEWLSSLLRDFSNPTTGIFEVKITDNSDLKKLLPTNTYISSYITGYTYLSLISL